MRVPSLAVCRSFVRGSRKKLGFKVWLCGLAESDCTLRVTSTHLCSADSACAMQSLGVGA
jgi:hypothetical protein